MNKYSVRFRWSTARNLSIWAGIALLAACASETKTPDERSVEKEGCGSLEEFKARYVFTDPEGVNIVNGDTPLKGTAELQDFYDVMCGKTDDELIVHRVNGNDAKWSDAQKVNLEYCISTSGFTAAQRTATITAMNQATAAWEAVANVNFVHDTEQDGNCTAS